MLGEKPLILVADSDEALLKRVTSLACSEDYDAVVMTTGGAVMETARRLRPALIVLEVALPDVDGRDLLRALKRDPEVRDIPVLMWSGRDYDSDRRIALELGAADYVPKSESVMLMPKIARVLLNAKRDSELVTPERR